MSVATGVEGKTVARKGMTRRTALGLAVAGGAGVAAVRLLGLDRMLPRPKTSGGRLDWVSPLGSEAARVAHLLRRTTFGAAPHDLESSISAGYQKTVDRLLESKPEAPPDLSAAATPGGRFALNVLQQWWIDHMLQTPTPFAERMTLFWHGHFTSDYRKVGDNTFLYWQNLTWRQHALGDLRTFLMQVTIDPAMLRYLDLATSTGQNPNENYSRELMELFSMGAGSFKEEDVRAGARALAGWTLPKPDGMASVTVANGVVRKYPTFSGPKVGVFDSRRGYKGQVTFLGKTGTFDTQAAVDRILAQPAVAPFITRKVLQHFVTPNPSDSYVKRLADRFRASKYNLKSLLRDVFLSPEFTADQSYRALVKSPIEFMVHALKAVNAPAPQQRLVLAAGAGMGQTIFDPPDVGGWPNNDSWISSNTVIARVNFVTQLLGLMQKAGLPDASKATAHHLDNVLSPQTVRFWNQATDDHTRWFLVLGSPEFQLK